MPISKFVARLQGARLSRNSANRDRIFPSLSEILKGVDRFVESERKNLEKKSKKQTKK